MYSYILLFIVLALLCWVLYAIKMLILWKKNTSSQTPYTTDSYFSSMYEEKSKKEVIIYSDTIVDDTITDDINTDEIDVSNIPDTLSLDDDDNNSNEVQYIESSENIINLGIEEDNAA